MKSKKPNNLRFAKQDKEHVFLENNLQIDRKQKGQG